MPSVLRYPGLAQTTFAVGRSPGSGGGKPPMWKLRLQPRFSSGALLISAMLFTLGSRFASSRKRCWKARICSSFAYLSWGRSMFATRTCAGSPIPVGSARRRPTVRIISPEPMASISASATSATTSADRKEPRAIEAGDPFLSASTRLGALACRAGKSPAATPEASESPSAKRSTGRWRRTSSSLGMLEGASATSASTPQAASSVPSAPPTSESSAASVRSWRTIWARELPSAARMAISRCRPAARASSMLATLAQAMSSTISAATSIASSTGLIGPTMSSSSGAAVIDRPACSS